jgi:hypothetical protein
VKHQPSEEVLCPICDLGANTWEQPAIFFNPERSEGSISPASRFGAGKLGGGMTSLVLLLPSCEDLVSVALDRKVDGGYYGSLASLGISETTI